MPTLQQTLPKIIVNNNEESLLLSEIKNARDSTIITCNGSSNKSLTSANNSAVDPLIKNKTIAFNSNHPIKSTWQSEDKLVQQYFDIRNVNVVPLILKKEKKLSFRFRVHFQTGSNCNT